MVVSLIQIQVFLLILARVVGLFIQAPILSDKSISKTFKVALIFTFTFLLWFVVPFNPTLMPRETMFFMLAAINEFLIGYMLAAVVRIIFEGVEAAGDLMGAQMGLSVASMLDPSTGVQTTVTARLLRWIVVLLFLSVYGHHFLLTALYKSFEVLPMLHAWNITMGAREIADLGAQIFAIAIELSAPILLVIFLIDFAFGLVSRVAPQVNVFQLGFQLKPPLGIFIFMLTVPLLLERIMWLINTMLEKMTTVMFFLRG